MAQSAQDKKMMMNGAVDSDPELEAELELAKQQPTSADGDRPTDAQLLRDLRLKQMRRTKSSEEAVAVPSPTVNGVLQVSRAVKNQRRTRCRGRGDAKKEGGGGKYTWGKLGKVYGDLECDPNDPNYDSDAAQNVTFEEMDAELTVEQVQKYVEPIILEFFGNSDLRDAIASIDQLEPSDTARAAIVRLVVACALDKKASNRELASELLAEMVSTKLLTQKEVEQGFVSVLNEDLTDLVLDSPDAANTVGNFMARAMADMALGPDTLERLLPIKDTMTNQHAIEALIHASTMWQNKHHLHDIWGLSGGQKPVRVLSNQMQLLLKEFLNSGDTEEAARCLAELEVPHFNHELVYQAGLMSIESMHARVTTQLCRLLQSLYESGRLNDSAIVSGFERLYVALPDITLDVPPAYTLAERWAQTARDSGFLPEAVARKVPNRGRKRFVSEGDGGRLKVIDVAHPLI